MLNLSGAKPINLNANFRLKQGGKIQKPIQIQKEPKKSIWTPQHKLFVIQPPQPVSPGSKAVKKRYSIRFQYLDPSKKKRTRTVYFGDIWRAYLPQHKDKAKAFQQLAKLKQMNNPLHPHYWVAVLLLRSQSIQQAYLDLVRSLWNQ